ncbi:MAG: TetR/AcrR family transcriptional regulator [Sphaerochaetaceae bacterium]|nr:TetR/AcrR family transcriptional regulator [Sphaerochaetaceae bacterium]
MYTNVPTKENQRISLSKHMLQDALLRLLETKRIDQIKIVELCKGAGVNRSTFYRLYNIPSEIETDIIQNIITEIYLQMGDFSLSNTETIKSIFRYIDTHRDVVTIIMKNMDGYIISFLENKYYQNFKHRYVITGSEEKCRSLCAFLVAGTLAITNRWINSQKPVSIDEVVETYNLIIQPISNSITYKKRI